MIRTQVKDKTKVSFVELIIMMKDAAAGLAYLHRYVISAVNSCYRYVTWMYSQLYSPKYCVKSICVSSRPCCSQFDGAYNLTYAATPHLHPASGYANTAGATHAHSHYPYRHRWMTSYVFTCPASASLSHLCVFLGCRLSLGIQFAGWPPRA